MIKPKVASVSFWGDNGLVRYVTPESVGGLPTSPSLVQAGNSASYAIVNGVLYAWGFNDLGQLGVGGSPNEFADAVRPNLPTSDSITTVGEGWAFAAAADSSGEAWAWGDNQDGVLCNPVEAISTEPIAITDFHDTSGVKQISGGYLHSVFLFNDGTVEACGSNINGELGNGQTGDSSPSPVVVDFPLGTDIVSINSGNEFTLAIDSSGNLWCWGYSAFGQCGVQEPQVTVPVRVHLEAPVVQAYAGGSLGTNGHSIVLLQNGTVWSFGNDSSGQLGNGEIGADEPRPQEVAIPGTVVAVAAGGDSSYAVDAAGNLWVWGDNSKGQLGDPALGNVVTTPEVSTTIRGVTAISATAATAVAVSAG